MANVITLSIILTIMIIDLYYIYTKKKKGECIGCPASTSCSKHGACHSIDFNQIKKEISTSK